jgi:hypothetical protein
MGSGRSEGNSERREAERENAVRSDEEILDRSGPVCQTVKRTSPPASAVSAARRHEPLPLGPRIFLLVTGWLLVVIGIAGLVLPGLQGFLTLLAAAAFLSAGSTAVHGFLRERFRRWPKGWRRMERWRRKLVSWLRPKDRSHATPPPGAPGE